MSTSTYIFILILFLLIASGLFIVKQQTFAVIERFGRFIAIRKPGLHIKIPLIDKIAGRLSLKILQLDVIVETKTKDNGLKPKGGFTEVAINAVYGIAIEIATELVIATDQPGDCITHGEGIDGVRLKRNTIDRLRTPPGAAM